MSKETDIDSLSEKDIADIKSRMERSSSRLTNLPDLSFAVDKIPFTRENEGYDSLIKLVEEEYEDAAAVAIVLAANGVVLPEKYRSKLLEGFTDYLEHKGEKDLETSLFGHLHSLKFATRQSRKNKYQHYFSWIDYDVSEYGDSARSALAKYLNEDDDERLETIYRYYTEYKKSQRDAPKK